MAKRLSHALLEARLEGFAEELDLSNTTIKDAAYTGFVKGTATVALTAAQSGRTIIVGPLAAGLAADSIFTLPTAADGLQYRFVYVGGAADAQDFQINTGSDTNFFIGGVIQHDIGGEDGAAYHPNLSSNSRINVLTPDAGTWVEVYCDGTNWFLAGWISSATNTGVTFADN
tara:strand:+ start:3958 stop:4473 length:516 start_codon:yes stop_codon:yes gene_type:complete